MIDLELYFKGTIKAFATKKNTLRGRFISLCKYLQLIHIRIKSDIFSIFSMTLKSLSIMDLSRSTLYIYLNWNIKEQTHIRLHLGWQPFMQSLKANEPLPFIQKKQPNFSTLYSKNLMNFSTAVAAYYWMLFVTWI